MKLRACYPFLAASLFGLTPFLSTAQPFNPFNVQQPIDTSGPNGKYYEIGNVSQRYHQKGARDLTPRYAATFIPIGSEKTLPIIFTDIIDNKGEAPPEGAAPFIGEPFYPHLTSLILENEVPKSLQKRLDNFQSARDAAAVAVIEKVAELEFLPAEEASTLWTTFEEQQSDSWKEIETERQKLFKRMQNGGFWSPGVDLADLQDLISGSGADYQTVPLIDLAALRHFTAGLSMDQRDLIGEFQIELTQPDQTEGPNRTLLISGTGSRIELPAELTTEQSQALRAYQQTKSELKEEILTSLLPVLHDWLRFPRLEEVASRLNKIQAPKFERMADQLEMLTLALSHPDNNSTEVSARLIGTDSPIDLEGFAMLSGSQRRLIAYSDVGR